MRGDYDGFVGRVDLRHLLTWTASFGPALLLPARFSGRMVDARVRARERRNPHVVADLAKRMEEYLGPGAPELDYAAQARAYEHRLAEMQWGRVRDLAGRRWPVTIGVDGLDRIQAAEQAGTGVILWQMSFGGNGTLPIKIALWRQGIELVHLSRAQHGIGRATWVAVNIIRPLYTRTEDRYIAERVTIPLDDSLGYMRVLIERLEDNAVLSIMGEERGRKMVTVPFLGRTRGFATGAPALAHKLGSALLPVHALRTAPLEYRVVVERPIEVDRRLPRPDFVTAAIAEFAERLGERIRAHPSDWDGWIKPHPSPTAGRAA